MFGSIVGDRINWTPVKGKEPNFFWRWMQFIFFGNRWVKSQKDNLSILGDTQWQAGPPDKNKCEHIFTNGSDYCIKCESKKT